MFGTIRRKLPNTAVERADSYLAGEIRVAPPRDAATVVLLRSRPAAPGIEVYLLRRVRSMPFAGGMYAFPGGTVDPMQDYGDVWHISPPDGWTEKLDASVALTKALACAAVRETLEEAGVLLAAEQLGVASAPDVSPGEGSVEDSRNEETVPFTRRLAYRGVALRADMLRPWAHWITPAFEPRRYDTRFFVAELPHRQRVRAVGGRTDEADRGVWLTPGDALAAYGRGEMVMMAPTAATLCELVNFDSVEAVMSHPRQLEAWLPGVRISDGNAYLILPGDSEEG